jgi:hypothetical protein
MAKIRIAALIRTLLIIVSFIDIVIDKLAIGWKMPISCICLYHIVEGKF